MRLSIRDKFLFGNKAPISPKEIGLVFLLVISLLGLIFNEPMIELGLNISHFEPQNQSSLMLFSNLEHNKADFQNLPKNVITKVWASMQPFTRSSTSFSLPKTKQLYEEQASDEIGRGVSIDNHGNIILVGDTRSSLFPTLNAYDSTFNGSSDAFIAKFDAAGVMLWSTFFGGTNGEEGCKIVVDRQNNIYVSGTTTSQDFPLLDSYYSSYNGAEEVFVAKFSPDGLLLWSTFLGGTSSDRGQSINIDSQDNIVVTGCTYSIDFPTKKAYNNTLRGGVDAFISKFASNGTLLWSTFVGGLTTDFGADIAVDSQDDILIIGTSLYRTPYVEVTRKVFISRFNSTGTWMWNRYLEGEYNDIGVGITIDSQNNIVVTGHTDSNYFPTLNAIYSRKERYDIFISKFNNTGELLWSSYFGGTKDDTASKILVDSQDNIVVTATTKSQDVPLVDAANSDFKGGNNGFIAKFSVETGTLIWSSALGGDGNDEIL
ncbi:MAG: SBBP repeat-containing protein, partial [Candidatus Hodarchaeota archaeon]